MNFRPHLSIFFHLPKSRESLSGVPMLILGITLGVIGGCTEVKEYRVSEGEVHQRAVLRGYQGPSRVEGFYDPVRQEVWCSSQKSCAHEWRHVREGRFH